MSIYLGGEKEEQEKITPKHYEKFFKKGILYMILLIMISLLLAL